MAKLDKEIDKLFTLNEKKKAAQAKLDDAKGDFIEQQNKVMLMMHEAGTTKAAGALASTSITKQFIVNVTDWNKFNSFIIRNKSLDLIQRRVSSTAIEERLNAGKKIPGIQTSTIPKLNMRKVSK